MYFLTIDPCSKILKRQILKKWQEANCDPNDTIVYFGIDWTEKHRLVRLQARSAPWTYEAPLVDPPYRLKRELLRELEAEGIEAPRLYKLGFSHNNCGGFCCKAGKSHFALLLRQMPERFAFHESEEARLRTNGINGTILTEARAGTKRPLTLTAFRERLQSNPDLQFDDDLAAGCGCAL